MKFTTKRETDGIAIYLNGDCMLFWNELEWAEDSNITYVIAEAIRQAYEEPEKLYKYLESKGYISEDYTSKATLTELEKLLNEANLPDLAKNVCVWSIGEIFDEVIKRDQYTKELKNWYVRWDNE